MRQLLRRQRWRTSASTKSEAEAEYYASKKLIMHFLRRGAVLSDCSVETCNVVQSKSPDYASSKMVVTQVELKIQ